MFMLGKKEHKVMIQFMWKQVYKHTYNLHERKRLHYSFLLVCSYDFYLFFCHNLIIRCTEQPSVVTYVLYIILTKDFRILQTLGYGLFHLFINTTVWR